MVNAEPYYSWNSQCTEYHNMAMIHKVYGYTRENIRKWNTETKDYLSAIICNKGNQ